MLETLRKGAGGWAARILLVLLAVSFVAWGVNDVYTGGGSRNVATIGGRDISVQEFEQAVRNEQQRYDNAGPEQLQTIQLQVLRRMVGAAAVDLHAARLGLGLSDAAIAEEIMKLDYFKDATGKFSRDRFKDVLEANRLTEAALVADIRRQAVQEQILQSVGVSGFAPQTLIDAVNRYQGETRVIKYFTLKTDAVGDAPQATPEQLSAFYEANKPSFTTPEYRKIVVMSATAETLKGRITVSDEDVRAAYEARKSTLGTPERRKIEQIAFPDMAAAQAARAKLTAPGADFAAVAKELGFNESDINLGTLAKSEMTDKKVADAVFALGKGEISQPIDGALSVVIARVSEITPGFTKSFDDAKAEIRDALVAERAQAEVPNVVAAVEKKREAGARLKEFAAEIGVPVIEATTALNGTAPGGAKVEGLPDAPNLLAEAFKTAVDQEGPALPVGARGDGSPAPGSAWFDVLEVTPERLKPLDEVRDEAAKMWRERELQTRLAAMVRDALKDAAPGGVEAVAKKFNATVKTSQPLRRGGAEPGLPTSAIALAFSLPQGAIEATPAFGGQAVISVETVTPPPALSEDELTRARAELGRVIGQDFDAQYYSAILADFGVSLNSKLLASLANPQ
ncbi:MAG: SurA N-terminal domain-containing protein [Hyphomicrobiales bacterium]|nr:SurA N-terminal domain-containing protein [Hyphomicrobiales bacterium]